MSTIVTRATKGSALTWTEGDANITNLNNDKIENVVEDLTPQLGGDLDVNGKQIVSTANGNINIVPNGSGNINLTPATGKVVISATNFPTGTGTNGQVLTTDGTGNASWTTPSSGGASTLDGLSDVVITAAATDDVLVYNGTNWVDTAASTLTVSNVSGTVAIANGGTGATSAPAANAALNGFTTTATAAAITTLTNASSAYQLFTGTSTQSVRLPDTATLAAGWSFYIVNNSTSNVTLQNATPSTLGTIYPGTAVMATCISIVGNTNASWEFGYTDFSTITGTGAVVLSTNPIISGGSINNATIGGTIPTTGAFTTLTAATTTLDDIRETVFTGGATTGTITPDAANGSIQKITLSGSITFNAFANPVAGQSMTLIITQSAVGGLTLTSTMKFANGIKILSTGASAVDILSVFYDGTTYYASLSRGYV